MRKLVVFFIVVLLLVMGGWYHVQNVKNKPIYANVLPYEAKIAEHTVAWPVIQELPDYDVQKRLNSMLHQELVRLTGEAVQMQKTSVHIEYLVNFNTANILSLTITESLYPERAAHPMTFLKAFTMNVRTGQAYQLPDLFKSGIDYKTRINEIIQQQIMNRGITFIAPYNGIKETDQEFYLTAKSVVVFYQLYEYTPYVYGFLKFEIPYEQLADILRPEFGQAVLSAQINLNKVKFDLGKEAGN